MADLPSRFVQQATEKIGANPPGEAGQKLGSRAEHTAEKLGEAAARAALEQGAAKAANAVPGGEIAARIALRTKAGQQLTEKTERVGGLLSRTVYKWGRRAVITATVLIVIPGLLIVTMLFGMFLGGGVGDNPPPMGILTDDQQQQYETVGVSPLVAYDSEYTPILDTVTTVAYQSLVDHWTAQHQPDTITNPIVAPNRTGPGVHTEAQHSSDGRVREGPWYYLTDRADCHPAVAAVKQLQYGTVHIPGDCWTLEQPPTTEFQAPATVVTWIEHTIAAQKHCERAGRFGCGQPLTGPSGGLPTSTSSRTLANDFYTLWLAWHNPQTQTPHHYPTDKDYHCAATFYEGTTFPTATTSRGTTWVAHLKNMGTGGNRGSMTDIEAGCADNRLMLLIGVLSARWPMYIVNIRTYHSPTISGRSSESSHHRGRAFDIGSVGEPNGQGQTVMKPIRIGTQAGKPMWDFIVDELFLKGRRLGVDQLGGPFPDVNNIQGVFTDNNHRHHFHIAVCGVRYHNYYERANLRDSCRF